MEAEPCTNRNGEGGSQHGEDGGGCGTKATATASPLTLGMAQQADRVGARVDKGLLTRVVGCNCEVGSWRGSRRRWRRRSRWRGGGGGREGKQKQKDGIGREAATTGACGAVKGRGRPTEGWTDRR